MSVGAFPVVVFHDVATEKEIAYMQREVRKQVRIYILKYVNTGSMIKRGRSKAFLLSFFLQHF